MKGYPRWFPWLLACVMFVLTVAGLALIPNFLFFKLDRLEEPFFNGKTRMGVAAAHVGAALTLAFLMGSVWSIHMRHGWRMKKHRVSGTLLVGSFLLLAITGIGSFYLADESWIGINGILHILAGASLILLAVVHPILGKLGKRRQPTRRRIPLRQKCL